MNYNPELQFESKIIPGVRATIKRLSATLRADVEIEIADIQQRIRDLTFEYAEHLDDPGEIDEDDKVVRAGDAPLVRKQKALRRQAIAAQIEALGKAARPVYVRRSIQKIDGCTIKGQPVTPINLVEDGPPELVDEIYEYISERNGLTPEEMGNSESPSTSAAPEGEKPSTSNAAAAGSADTTAGGTAPCTIPGA
jgi:hypothetical protein